MVELIEENFQDLEVALKLISTPDKAWFISQTLLLTIHSLVNHSVGKSLGWQTSLHVLRFRSRKIMMGSALLCVSYMFFWYIKV